MNTDIEPVLAALLTHLASAVSRTFTGNTSEGSASITNVSSFAGLFAGMGVDGPGVPINTIIDAMDAQAQTITLSQQLTANGTGATFTGGFLTVSRRLKWWDKTENQPALFLRHIGQDDDNHAVPNTITTLDVEAWIYSRAGQVEDYPPDIALNQLVRLVKDSMQPDDRIGMFFTIGGLCHWCRIEGRTDYDDGTLDKQSKCVLPIKITLP